MSSQSVVLLDTIVTSFNIFLWHAVSKCPILLHFLHLLFLAGQGCVFPCCLLQQKQAVGHVQHTMPLLSSLLSAIAALFSMELPSPFSHCIHCTVRTYAHVLLLDLFTVTCYLYNLFKGEVWLKLQFLRNIIVWYTNNNSVPDLFVFSSSKLTVLCQLTQASNKSFNCLSGLLHPLVKACITICLGTKWSPILAIAIV